MTNESEDILYEMAEQGWNECWPDEPDLDGYVPLSKVFVQREWLLKALSNMILEYDGPCSDIADHIGDFGDRWIEKRVQAIREEAREAEAVARVDNWENR